MKGMRGVLTSVNNVTIYESMIKYMGRDTTYILYMHAKPIKYGIKVFAFCCTIYTIIIGFKVYVGQEDDSDKTALVICDDLVKEAGITSARGRTLYIDNYYISMALAKNMFNKYGWTMFGTILPTDKKSRSDHDIPFLQLSNVSRNGLKQGWYRKAVINLKTLTSKAYYIQCTTLRDKKQLCFLSPNEVGYTEEMTGKRHNKKKKKQEIISGPRTQRDYVTYFNAVDNNDHDISFYSTTIQKICYYLIIFCCALDCIVHTLFVVV